MRKIYISLGCALLMQLTNSLSAQVLIDEDFSGTTGTTPPSGWVNNDIAGNGDMWAFDNPGSQDLLPPITDPAAIFDSDETSNDGNAEEVALESPAFDANVTGFLLLSFDHTFYDDDFTTGAEYFVEVWDGTSWVEAMSGSDDTDGAEHVAIDITALANGATNAKVRFRWTGDWSYWWIVDNVIVQSVTCLPISALTLDGTTDNSIDISWTAGGTETDWDIEYGPTGFTPGTGIMASTTTESFSLGSLSLNTYYDFYVRANCGGGDQSSWTGPLAANTPDIYCEVVGLDDFQYINSFSTTGGTTNISNLNSGFNGYEHNTSMVVTSFVGGPDINFNVDFDFTGTYGLGIWVDWNNDTTFDASEQMYVSDNYYDSFSGSFSVPAGTSVGSYRMRVMGAYYDQAPADACFLDSDEGEVEDYTFAVTTPPACLPVADFTFTNVVDTAISIAWTAQGSETNWVIEYGTEGFTPGTGSIVSSSTESFTVDTLTANTQYDFYVQADCGGDSSLWVGPFTAQTGYCEVAGLNSNYYINDFSTTGGSTNISNLNSGFNGGYADNTSMTVTSFNGGPDVNFSADFHDNGGTYGLGIWVDWNNNSIFEGGEQMFVSPGYSTSFTGSFAVPTGTTLGTYRMRVMGTYNNSQPTNPCLINFDNGDVEDYSFEVVAVPSCLPVIDITLDSNTTTTADISWTATGTETDWDIEYGPAGFMQGTGMTGTSTTESYSAVLLTPNTLYDFYVRANCGGGDESYWMGPLSVFTGYCQVEGTDSSYYINEFMISGGIDTIDNVASGFDGYQNNTAMVVSSFDGAPALDFSIDFSSGNYGLGIWVDWNNNLTFDASEEMFVSDGYEYSFAGSFAVPSGTPVGSYTMRVMAAYNDSDPTDPCFLNANNGEVQDYTLEVLPQPSCMPVTDLVVTNQTSTSIDIAWTSQGSETDWDIEWGEAGFAQGSGTMTSSTTPTFSLGSLTPDTDYDFYVRANCGGGDNSLWLHVTGRTGYCVVEGIDDYVFINNFHTTGGATSNISNLNSDFANNGYEDATSMSVSQFAAGPEINFDVDFGNGYYLGFGIWVDWNNDMMFDASEQMFMSNDYDQEFSGSFGVPAGTPVGTYRMRTMCADNDGSPSDACDIPDMEGEVEDYTFEVVPTPSCLPVSDIVTSNITTTSVDLVWNVNGSEGLWNIQWGPVGFTPGTGTEEGSASSNDIVYTVNGLNPSTTYDLYIQANCGADSSYWTMVNFTTLCGPIASLPWTENFDAMQDVDQDLFPNCWVANYSGDWLTDNPTVDYTGFMPYSNYNFLAMLGFNNGENVIWTPEFQLTAGSNYEFTFMWAGDGETEWSGEVLVNSEQSSSGATPVGDPFVEEGDETSETYRKATYCFTPDTNGVYSFGIHVTNFDFDYLLTFDDFSLVERTGSAGTDGSMNVCQTEGLVDLNDVVTIDDQSGVWSFNSNPATIVNDTLFNPQFVPSGTIHVSYITTGCLVDTATAIITIYGPSMAGEDGSISACKNEPLNLLSGLNGTITTGGNWYNPSNAVLPSGQITTGAFPGSFNYRYITGNGICPDDTSLVVVTVTNCDWLSIGENELEGVNVYPNPSTGLVYIESTFSTASFNLVITDVNGRVIDNKNNTIVAGTNAVHLENVERGVYFFKLSNNTAEKIYRVVIE